MTDIRHFLSDGVRSDEDDVSTLDVRLYIAARRFGEQRCKAVHGDLGMVVRSRMFALIEEGAYMDRPVTYVPA